MNIEAYRDYCLSKKGVTEGFPFNQNILVFKVGSKIFALTNIDTFESINLKCKPEYAIELREEFVGIKPGYHMNKKHWNTIVINSDVSDKMLFELIDLSYQLVFKSLTKKKREGLV